MGAEGGTEAGRRAAALAERAFDAAARLARAGLWLGAALFALAYLAVVANRIGYPFELDKMEGGTVDHVARLVAGLPIYVAPSPDFVPYAYTPLFLWIAAAVSKWTGVGFLPLRLVSFAASLGCVALLARFVWRETRDGLASTLAAGLFLASYPRSGAWLDVGRIDTLFLMLLLAGLLLLRGPASPARRGAAGLVLALAFLAKQTALPIALLGGLCALVESRRAGLAFVATLGGVVGASVTLLDRLSDGWFRFYVFTLQSRIPVLPGKIDDYWRDDLWTPFAAALLFGLFYVLALAAGSGDRRTGGTHAPFPGDAQALRFHVLVSGGTLGVIWLARISFGAYDNVLLPAHAVVALGFGLGFHRARSLVPASGALRPALGAFVALAAVLQLASLVYDPRALVPSPADRAAGEELVARLRAAPGPVLVAHHGDLARRAGKPLHAQGVAVSDLVLRDRGGPAESAFSAAMRADLRARRWALVVTDTTWWYDDALAAYYEPQRPVFDRPDVFYPITGARSRPEILWTPRAAPPEGGGPPGPESPNR